jgi:hypothetical protein
LSSLCIGVKLGPWIRAVTRLKGFQYRLLKGWLLQAGEKLHSEKLHILYSSSNITRMVGWRRTVWTGHAERMGNNILVRKPERKDDTEDVGEDGAATLNGSYTVWDSGQDSSRWGRGPAPPSGTKIKARRTYLFISSRASSHDGSVKRVYLFSSNVTFSDMSTWSNSCTHISQPEAYCVETLPRNRNDVQGTKSVTLCHMGGRGVNQLMEKL